MKNNKYIKELQKLLNDKEIDTVLVRLMTQNFCYKQRIDKAIEELEYWKPLYNEEINKTANYLLNILRGEDNE